LEEISRKGTPLKSFEDKMKRLHQFDLMVKWFDEYLLIKGYRPRTIKNYLFELSLFRRWLETITELTDLDDFSKELLSSHTLFLYEKNYAPKTIHSKLSTLKCFFKALYEENKIYRNLVQDITLPRIGKRLPTNILTKEETIKLFSRLEEKTDNLTVQTFSDAVLIRDRLILELLYSCGLRSSELRNISLDSIDYSNGFLTVIDGKGGKDRVIPIGSIAVNLVERYVSEARPFLLSRLSRSRLLLSRRGGIVSPNTLREVVQKILAEVGIEKQIRVHDFRHTCATHMLNAGADIRYVQELLGHKCLSSTQIYTHVAIDQLKKSHREFHPREKWEE